MAKTTESQSGNGAALSHVQDLALQAIMESTSPGLSKPALLQVLNNGKPGLFVPQIDLALAGFNGGPANYVENHTHLFGRNKETPKEGLYFPSINMVVLRQSPIIVEHKKSGNLAVGEFGNAQMEDLFMADRQQAGDDKERRQFQCRNKWLVALVDDNGDLLCENVLLFTLKGLTPQLFIPKLRELHNAAKACYTKGKAIQEGSSSSGMTVELPEQLRRGLIWKPTFQRSQDYDFSICEVGINPVPDISADKPLESLAQFISMPAAQMAVELDNVPNIDDFHIEHALREHDESGGKFGGMVKGYLRATSQNQDVFDVYERLIAPTLETVTEDSAGLLTAAPTTDDIVDATVVH